MSRIGIRCFALLWTVAAAALVACSGEVSSGDEGDQKAPQVVSTTPADGATEVSLTDEIQAVFDEEIDEATLADGFTIEGSTDLVSGTVSYDSDTLTATFAPVEALAGGMTYVATLSTTVADVAGNRLAAAHTWSFTTSDVDETPPQVQSTNPAADATDVALNAAITATFDESVDATTVDEESFTLTGPEGLLAGNIAVSDNIVTLNPDSDLEPNTTYTAELTTAITDLAGNALAAAHQWQFETGAAADATPPLVVSTQPEDGASDVSVATTIEVEFSEDIDSATLDSSSFQLDNGTNGTVQYDSVSFTATFVPSGELSYATEYTATITTSVTDLAGNSLPTEHTWSFTTEDAPDTTPPSIVSTSPAENATDVSINAQISVEFDEAVQANTVSSTSFTLNDGTSDIAASVAYDEASLTATLTPDENLAYDTSYTATLTTAITDAAGNALETAYSWSFLTASVPDTTSPSVVSVTPADNATGVLIGITIGVEFSEPIDESTLVFILRDESSNDVAANVTYSAVAQTAGLTPDAPLDYSTTYTVIVSSADDLSGNPLADSPVITTFTTEADTYRPQVDETTPVDGANSVRVDVQPTVSFSEALDCEASNDKGDVVMEDAEGTTVKLTNLSCADNQLTVVIPELEPFTTYTVTVTTSVFDTAGNALASNYSWSFTTGSEGDTTAPEVLSTSPADLATDVLMDASIDIVFSERLATATAIATNIKLFSGSYPPGTAVSTALSYDGDRTVTLSPDAMLAADTNYHVIVETGVTDVAGNPIAAQYHGRFTTGAEPVAPEVVAVTPIDGSSNVDKDTPITIEFSEAMDETTLAGAITLTDADSTTYDVSVSYDNGTTTATLTPLYSIPCFTDYTITVDTTAEDANGYALEAAFSWSFSLEWCRFTLGAADNETTAIAVDSSDLPSVAYTSSGYATYATNAGGWTWTEAHSFGPNANEVDVVVDSASGYHFFYVKDYNDLYYYGPSHTGYVEILVYDGADNAGTQYCVPYGISAVTDSSGVPFVSFAEKCSGATATEAVLLGSVASDGSTGIAEIVSDAAVEALGLDTDLAFVASEGVFYVTYHAGGTGGRVLYRKVDGATLTGSLVTSTGYGEHASVAINSSGTPVFVYHDGDLAWEELAGTEHHIDATADDVGEFNDLVIDSAGNMHISYYDQTNQQLKYATNATGSWVIDVVDAGNVGRWTSIALDSSNGVHISYYDAANGTVKYATNMP